MKTEVVIAAYRPKEGKAAEVNALLKKHVPTLRRLELLTDRPELVLQAKNGTILEIFEWRSAEAAHQAHEHPAVAAVWEALGAVADFKTLGTLEEAGKPFAHFTPLEL